MRKFLVCCLILVLMVSVASGSPLIFKTVKEIKNEDEKEFVELASVDVSKYKQIRVGVILVSGKSSQSGKVIRIEAVEGSDLIWISGFGVYEVGKGRSQTVENLPNKIRISANESGTYKIFVWGQ